MRLFASLMVSLPPQRLSAHPFGIENAWLWLSRVVNIRTHPDITATMVIDLLEVTGHALHREYRKQFLKMLLVLFHEYVPKLKLAASSGGGEAVYRLEALIKTGIEHQGHIPPPEGLLSQNVWFSWWTLLWAAILAVWLFVVSYPRQKIEISILIYII